MPWWQWWHQKRIKQCLAALLMLLHFTGDCISYDGVVSEVQSINQPLSATQNNPM
jgi:hypothetical protein